MERVPRVRFISCVTKVDETSSDGNSTYIQNNNTTSPVILDYDYTQSKPAGIITVTVNVTAEKTASGSTRKIQGFSG